MNFLAHAVLAGDSPSLIVGGVIGDWIKGPIAHQLPDDIARGVRLHRAIDSFAETNPGFCASRQRMSAQRRRYAGVLVDIFYDHLLARQWTALFPAPLETYTRKIYALINERMPDLPVASHPALDLMAREDWLGSYVTVEGIANVLQRMAWRARQPNPLAGGETELLAHEALFHADFTAWLGDALDFAHHWRSANDAS